MALEELIDRVSSWPCLKTFCFFYPLRTGVQFYGFMTCVISIHIVDVLAIKLIEDQVCLDYRNAANLHACSSTKQIIVSQACLAAMSILLLYRLKQPGVAMSWVGCRLVVSIGQLLYLPHRLVDLLTQLLGHFWTPHIALITCIIIVLELYGVLVAANYHAELIRNQPSSSQPTNNETETVNNIPVPPKLPNLVV